MSDGVFHKLPNTTEYADGPIVTWVGLILSFLQNRDKVTVS